MAADDNGNGRITLAVHENKIETIEKNVDLILTNHLPHIYEELKGTNKALTGVLGGLVAALILLVINLVTK